jgi:hypothetical protein
VIAVGQPALPVLDLLATQPAPSRQVVVATGGIALAAVVYRPAWRIVRHVVTIAHEGGHAGIALLVGRRLSGVRLHSDTSGLTVSRGRPTGIGVVLVLLAGYLAPSALGLAMAFALSRGYAVATLWGWLGLLALLLVAVRNLFGVISVLATGAVVFAISWWATPAWQNAAAYQLAWFLLIAGPWPVAELQSQRSRRRARTSDVDQLAALTHVPGLIWVSLLLVVTAGGLILGGRWLVP